MAASLPMKVLGLIRRANEAVVIVIFAVMSSVVFFQVVARYVFNAPPSWSEEIARYLQVWMVMLASATCMQRGQHITITYITDVLPAPLERALGVLINLVVITYLLIVIWYSGELMRAASLQRTPATNLPMLAVYLSVLIGTILILFESIVTLVRRLRGLDPFERIVREEAA
jgi:TRAP-type C4-dicarboxylate transport system permease small subunit